MPHRGTGEGIWYRIERDTPTTLFVTYPWDIPEAWLREVRIQVQMELGEYTVEHMVPESPNVVQLMYRMSSLN